MAISGSGTEQNPYIVDTWSDFEQVNTLAYTESYVKFASSGSVSLVAMNRDGYDGLEIFPHVNGNGFNLKNLYLTGSNPVVFHQEVKNLNILNFCYTGDSDSIFYFKGSAKNMKFTGISLNCDDTTVFSFDESCLLWNASLTLISNTPYFALMKDGNGGMTYSHMDLSVTANTSACIAKSNSTPTISHCLFTGSITSPTITNVLINSSTFEYNVYDLTTSSDTSVSDGGSNIAAASIFNGDKMTVTAPIGVITSCSSEQMIDSDYLKQHGFAMAY